MRLCERYVLARFLLQLGVPGMDSIMIEYYDCDEAGYQAGDLFMGIGQ